MSPSISEFIYAPKTREIDIFLRLTITLAPISIDRHPPIIDKVEAGAAPKNHHVACKDYASVRDSGRANSGTFRGYFGHPRGRRSERLRSKQTGSNY
jgi:hypothetical protein